MNVYVCIYKVNMGMCLRSRMLWLQDALDFLLRKEDKIVDHRECRETKAALLLQLDRVYVYFIYLRICIDIYLRICIDIGKVILFIYVCICIDIGKVERERPIYIYVLT